MVQTGMGRRADEVTHNSATTCSPPCCIKCQGQGSMKALCSPTLGQCETKTAFSGVLRSAKDMRDQNMKLTKERSFSPKRCTQPSSTALLHLPSLLRPPGKGCSCCSCSAGRGKKSLPGFKIRQTYRLPVWPANARTSVISPNTSDSTHGQARRRERCDHFTADTST